MALKFIGDTWAPTYNEVGYQIGAGDSATPYPLNAANEDFLELRCKTTATSGGNRLAYMRYDMDGAGASGETIRALNDLGAAVTNARGAHISLQAGATGYASGLGAGVDAQLYIKNETLAGGTYAAHNVEIYAAGASTVVSGVTSLSLIRCAISGNATGAAAVEDAVNLLTLTGGSNASGNVIGAVGNEPTWASHTYLCRCNLNGTVVYLVGISL